MPKNNSDAKMSRSDNKADKKNNRPKQMLKNSKLADYVPSLNNVPKNEI
ncbi:hypothetical protein [Paenibacillus sp. sgz500958]